MTGRVEQIGDATLYLGDCLEILPTLGKVDAVVTDPPYGVGFKYASHDDSHAGYAGWCAQWFGALRLVSDRIAISCGIANLQMWPKPDWTLCWHKPASMGRCHVGFNNWEPVILYGRSPRQIVDVFRATITPDHTLDGHPCPKPLGWGMALVDALSADDETILDPFMGSGTTGVACAKLGRKFIGIEIDEGYFDIACKRIDDAYKQADLFVAPPAPKPKQVLLDV
jgi:site-specific DNA-methyltransferase (adenine-specific)